uniref:Integrase catalytic domain-containing protein n=1 Tax=Fagus sylvatica TaxID=28930 RepID=A0A2N9GKE3_FAGSY
MRGGRVGFIENRARLAQHHHARRMTVLRELWYCHVAVLSFHASSPSNPPRFPCAYPFLSDFRGQFWRSSGTQNWVMRHIVGKLSTSSFQRYKVCTNRSSDEGVMAPGSRGIGAVFVHSSGEDSDQTGDAFGEPRVPRRSRSHYLSNAPGLADQLVASRKDSAREGGSCAAYFCKVPDSRESELGLVRYGPASRVHRGVFGPFEGSFPIRIPADPDKFLAIREFHVVHGCVLFPMCPGSQINLLRVRKTLCASVATSALHRGELGFARYDPANGGRRNVPYAKGALVGSDRLGSGCLVLRADTRENPGDAGEANRLIQEMHAGLMGVHANGPFLARKIMRAGYYWLTMERDCIRHVQTCHKCQMYQNSKNAPPQYLHTMASPWPFSAWGMDVIGAITPKASNGHEFILVAIDYFTKWVEACSFKNVTQVAVTRFVKNNIIYRYGMPEMLITDNASNLNNHSYASSSRPSTITLRHTPLPTLWYMGWKAVLPVEVEIPSLRILSQTQLEEAEWAQARYEQLNFIDEKRLAALCHGQLYQRRIERAYNKKARPRTFQARRPRSEEEEYGPIRSTRESSHHHMRVRTW